MNNTKIAKVWAEKQAKRSNIGMDKYAMREGRHVEHNNKNQLKANIILA